MDSISTSSTIIVFMCLRWSVDVCRGEVRVGEFGGLMDTPQHWLHALHMELFQLQFKAVQNSQDSSAKR